VPVTSDANHDERSNSKSTANRLRVRGGSTVMDAAHNGIYVPHFCWHRSSRRGQLPDVPGAGRRPKPMPTCATPATEGMKVWTHSDAAVAGRDGSCSSTTAGVPDCERRCRLQDRAVGYGRRIHATRAKRVVLNKNLGP
jgi:NADH-quinone oxidoreductase subunit G